MRALVTALLLVLGTSAGAESICISASGNTREAETLANAYCSDDPGFASGYEVKITPDYIVLRVTILPSRLDIVRSEAGALKAAHAVGDRLLRLSQTVIVAFVPVRIGNDEPFRTVTLGKPLLAPAPGSCSADLKRIRGVATWDGDTLKLTVYNGTACRVTEISVKINGAEVVVLAPLPEGAAADVLRIAGSKPGLNPADTGAFTGKAGVRPEDFRWEIVAVQVGR